MSIDLKKRAVSGPTMGTRWSAVFYAPGDTPLDPIAAELANAVALVDHQMSTWKPQSDLMQLNRTPVGQWIEVPDEMAYVLALGLGIARQSDGRFDMAVFQAVDAWGFGPSSTPAPLAPTARPVGEALEVEPAAGRARRLLDVAFDLSGIAKGFAVDLMARRLEGQGIADFVVAIDGELQASGRHADGRPWQVGLEAPQQGRRDVAHVLTLSDCSIATSGDYRHRRQVGNRWVSHTIDPRTGRPVDNSVASVTVRMSDCIAADAWATALLVAGEIEGPELARDHDLDALFLVRGAAEVLEPIGTGCFAEVSPVAA